jgi:hypothetical protein
MSVLLHVVVLVSLLLLLLLSLLVQRLFGVVMMVANASIPGNGSH